MSGWSAKDQPRLDMEITRGRFKNQVAVVTGGAGGIGKMVVHRLVG